MTKYNSEIYNDYIKGSYNCSFEEYLYDEYNLLKFHFEQSEDWSDYLGSLISDLYASGVLVGTPFENKVKNIYQALECE